MTRITQAQVKIAETIEREGALTAPQIADAHGARIDNARRSANNMVESGYLSLWDNRYSLTRLGRDEVLLSHAARTLQRARRKETAKPVETDAPADLFAQPSFETNLTAPVAVTHLGADDFQWTGVKSVAYEPKADPVFIQDFIEDIYPIVTEAVMLDIAGHNISLSVDDAQELRDALNKFFGDA